MELEGRKILVTGCAGFIASHMAEELLEHENEVVGVDNLSAGKMEFMSKMMDDPDFVFMNGDLLTMDLSSALKDIEVVCHFAANPDVRLGAADTSIHFKQNIEVTYRLLEAGKKSGVKEFLFPSTSTVYGEATVPTPENFGPMKPISIYGASKLACEALISSYCYSFDQRSVIYRFANVVGPRSTHNVLHDFIHKLEKDPHHLEILGSEPGTIKSYVHVGDCVSGMIAGAEAAEDKVEIYNLGSLDWMNVRDIADIVVDEMHLPDVKYEWTGGVQGGRGWVGDVKKMLLSVDKLGSIGWEPTMTSAQAIRRAVQEILLARGNSAGLC